MLIATSDIGTYVNGPVIEVNRYRFCFLLKETSDSSLTLEKID